MTIKKGEDDEGRMAKISGDNAVLIISHIGQGFRLWKTESIC